jgi:phage tail-like protein
MNIWNWIKSVLEGQVRRADGTIILMDENRQEVRRWNFRRGWPCKWTRATYHHDLSIYQQWPECLEPGC